MTRIQPGDEVATGERMGLMKFGSRMDVFVPPEVLLEVSKGNRAIGGETVLGRFPAVGPLVTGDTAPPPPLTKEISRRRRRRGDESDDTDGRGRATE